MVKNPNLYFLLENVVMAKEWENIFTKVLGVKPIKINSSLVSAQNRVRLYWTNIPFVGMPEDKGITLQSILEDIEFDHPGAIRERYIDLHKAISEGDLQSIAHYESMIKDFEVDFITLSPYMGMDSIEPYMPYMESGNKGVFVLVRTSNPGAEDIENIDTKDESKVYKVVGDKLTKMGESIKGECGYSAIGGVIGCTHVEEGKEIRERYKDMFFLIPGYGAQGGKAEDVALYLRDGNGGVVNSSRAILLAYKKENKPAEFADCARREAIRMRDEIRNAVNNL